MEVLGRSRAVFEGVFTVVRGMIFEGSRHVFFKDMAGQGNRKRGETFSLFMIRFRSALREV